MQNRNPIAPKGEIMIKPTQAPTSPRMLEPIYKLWNVHKPLAISVIYTFVLLLFFIAGIFADGRIITGVPAWLKPSKFAISITIYSITLLWFLNFIDTTLRWRKTLVKLIGWTVLLAFAAEWFAIITQAIRGTSSHFNVATPFDATLWGIMAIAIMILWIANFILAALLLLQRFENPAFAWALRLGLIITIIGMGLGYLMTDPTPEQLEGLRAGQALSIIGAHSVGVADGNGGLPLMNWSSQGGDLRIGHFVGMHALQVIPLFALFLMRRRRLNQTKQTQLVWLSSAIYLALTLLTTWQALRAQSIIAPDALTMTVFASILGLGVVFSLIILIRKPQPTNEATPFAYTTKNPIQ